MTEIELAKVYENKSNSQKLVTVPSESDIEDQDFVRMINLGENWKVLPAQNKVHFNLRVLSTLIVRSDHPFKEKHYEELPDEFVGLLEEAGEKISEAMTMVNKTYGVLESAEQVKRRTKNDIEKHKPVICEKREQSNQNYQSELKELKEEHGIESFEYDQGYDIIETEDGEEYHVRTAYVKSAENEKGYKAKQLEYRDEDKKPPEHLDEFVKQKSELWQKHENEFIEWMEDHNYSHKHKTAEGRAISFDIFRRGDWEVKVPSFNPEPATISISDAEE